MKRQVSGSIVFFAGMVVGSMLGGVGALLELPWLWGGPLVTLGAFLMIRGFTAIAMEDE